MEEGLFYGGQTKGWLYGGQKEGVMEGSNRWTGSASSKSKEATEWTTEKVRECI